MCGFVGVVNPSGTFTRIISQMTQALVHRGPDDSGLVCCNESGSPFIEFKNLLEASGNYQVSLGFQRLSILDLTSSGHQPMLSPDKRFAIVYNGEVYNFKELRAELAQKGVIFCSNTDTEVVLALYVQYGPEMLQKLNGMFAFAIYDRVTDSLFLARDRLGIKPLYYYQNGPFFMFGSEVKTFWFHPRFTPDINKERMDEYLLFRYVAGEETLLTGVKVVLPGTYMILSKGVLVKKRYWNIPTYQPESINCQEAQSQFLQLLKSSVDYQLISDVKVGCQLSGGIDSSLVSDYAAKIHGGLFDSISVVFNEPEYTEELYIDSVNHALGLTGHKALLDVETMISQLERATWHFDFPLSQPNSLGIMMLAKEAKRHVKVLLSGEGADEVFGGYTRFYAAAWLNRFRKIPGASKFQWVQKNMNGFYDFGISLICLSSVGHLKEMKKIYPDFSLERAIEWRKKKFLEIQETPPLERLLTYEQETYLVELLLRQDKMCMASSIENRVPLLDHRIVELAKTLPTHFKISLPFFPRRGQVSYHTKKILKKIASKRYDKAFAYRAKSGFAVPLKELFLSKQLSTLQEICKPYLKDLGFDNPVQSLSGVEIKWTLLALAVWLKLVKEMRVGRKYYALK